MAEKRYYWLKLKDDFFTQLEMKKLRRIAGGDTYVIIVLELQLLSLKTDGVLEFTGLEEDFAAELSLAIDEDVDNISFVLMYLKKIGWLVEETENVYTLPNTIENIGSETYAAKRMRKMRNNNITKLRNDVTMLQDCSIDIDTNKEKNKEPNQYNSQTAECVLPDFECFYSAYPRKVSKGKALKVWQELNPSAETVEKIMKAVEVQKNSEQWNRDNGRYIPYPENYLLGRRWEDEMSVVTSSVPNYDYGIEGVDYL